MKTFFVLVLLMLEGAALAHPVMDSVDVPASLHKNHDRDFILEVLWKVIAREGRSKNYHDLDPLDGGTVGIAHFAVGGLEHLYKVMDTEKYFSRNSETMIRRYSSQCRPHGRRGNDTGWGCYSKDWWRQGMRNFLYSSDSKELQDRAFVEKMQPLLTRVRMYGWKSPRKLAIAMGIANSFGRGGFIKMAERHDWRAEEVLLAYAHGNAHRQRRADAINKFYPLEQ